MYKNSVMHLQSCCFANQRHCFFAVLVSVAVVVVKAPLCPAYREVTGSHFFFLQACSFDQFRCGSSQLCSEVDIVGVVVFCTPLSCFSNSRYASNRGYKVVFGHLFKDRLSSAASSSSLALSSSSSSQKLACRYAHLHCSRPGY